MSIPNYSPDKYYRIMDNAQMNYANQYKRLSKNEKRGDFILIYYSLALIIYSVTAHFYKNLFDNTWLSYSSIILSVIVLVYSIINSKADYSNRVRRSADALNQIKSIKRELGSLSNKEMSEETNEKLNDIVSKYNAIVNSTEVRDDLDFYYTIKSLCKKYNLSLYRKNQEDNGIRDDVSELSDEEKEEIAARNEVIGYIAENRPLIQLVHVILHKLWHGLLYLFPVIIFVVGLLIKIC